MGKGNTFSAQSLEDEGEDDDDDEVDDESRRSSSVDLNATYKEDQESMSLESNKVVMISIGKEQHQGKVCARGHWRPAEDAKLKELVGIYGPQNWNLIAEKLEGRSGK